MAGGAPLLQQREIADLLLAYLPAIDAARGAMRVCWAWHEAAGRVHGCRIAFFVEAVKHGQEYMFVDGPDCFKRAVQVFKHRLEPATVGNIEIAASEVTYNILLRPSPLLLRKSIDRFSIWIGPYRPFLNPRQDELAAEKLFYVLTGIDLRAM